MLLPHARGPALHRPCDQRVSVIYYLFIVIITFAIIIFYFLLFFILFIFTLHIFILLLLLFIFGWEAGLFFDRKQELELRARDCSVGTCVSEALLTCSFQQLLFKKGCLRH